VKGSRDPAAPATVADTDADAEAEPEAAVAAGRGGGSAEGDPGPGRPGNPEGAEGPEGLDLADKEATSVSAKANAGANGATDATDATDAVDATGQDGAGEEGEEREGQGAGTGSDPSGDPPTAAATAAETTDAPDSAEEAEADAGAAEPLAERPDADTGTGAGPGPDTYTDTDTGTDRRADSGAAEPVAEPVGEGAEPEAPSAPVAPAVDQPTAVFKAFSRKPSAPPAVDHPTTALKLPPAPRPESNPAAATPAAAPAAPAPAAAGERASTFVPLRRDDAVAAAPRGASEPTPAALTEPERTAQQPMPPQPPLDLLAQLTNTPDNAVRTVVRRVKIWTPLLVLLLIVFAVVQVLRPLPDPTLKLTAEPEFTFQGGKLSLPFPTDGQGAVEVEGVGTMALYGEQKPAPIASVAKAMTAYVILKEHPISGKQMGAEITVDQRAEDESKKKDESKVPIRQGQKFSQRHMLELLMVPSGNNAARLLARWDAGSEAEFVEKMNAAAKDLGMNDSVYTDPSGLLATTVSTPQDQLKLAEAVMQNDIFREIVDSTSVEVPGIEGKIYNNNDRALLQPGVGGIKTGSSTPAGGNLLWSADVEVDGKLRRVLGVTMGVKDAKNLDAKLQLAITHSITVIADARKAVTSATVIKKGQVVGHIDNGMGGSAPVVATQDLKALGWAGHRIEIAINDGGKTPPRSAAAGDVVGQVSVGTGTGRATAPVALQQDLSEPGFGDKLTRLG
ncbi:D-alanyl-D-alanine carboxypeptidase family protein, partial [Streptomyces sp. NPDC055078]